MKAVLIANPKGGSGKSTLATNLAGHFALKGHGVMLGDLDRQQSAREWLALRPASLPPSGAGRSRKGRRPGPPRAPPTRCWIPPPGSTARAWIRP